MLCYDGQLRNNSIITEFHTDSSAATGSDTSNDGTVPEPTSRNEEQTRNAPSSYLVLTQKLLSELICTPRP